MDEKATFDTWGIVELFGHQRIAGKLTEQVVAGATMLRVDVPEVQIRGRQMEIGKPIPVETVPGFTKFYGSGAIYGITPTDEPTARLAAASLRVEPCERWRLEPLKQIEARAETPEDVRFAAPDYGDPDDDGQDDDDNPDGS